jgi:NAD(P)-dependent dehydrogenase (short-subunit alcohol dehydrogenase family)
MTMAVAPAKEIGECGVVVLGGTAGVGLETAIRFARHGARVVLLGRNSARGADAVAQVRRQVPDATIHFVTVDAIHPSEATRAERDCCELLGGIDVLVSTVGPSRPPRLLHTIDIDEVSIRIDEIMLPPLHMMHAVLPAMRRQGGGSVINVASDAAKLATPGETLIGAAMAAIVMFSKAAALEAKREGVRINLLTPSLIAGTPGADLIGGEPFSARMFAKAAAMAHLGVAESADLAEMILYLAGPAARRITGQAISINGGISVA